jgi:NAD(P)-dependent dehydrogenase (short-subunit alcohol dehydrogenase family)/pimeloyl-ACP methyl ester carboxylesterase
VEARAKDQPHADAPHADAPHADAPHADAPPADQPRAARTRRVQSDGAELWVKEVGAAPEPTVVFVHGFPDTHAVWDEVFESLADRFHVVAYDVRGMGSSTAPNLENAFSLEQLALDLKAVLDAVSPDRPVHLVGHDWGAFQCWEALSQQPLRRRIASFTAVAGPRIDDTRGWVIRRLLRPSPAALAGLAGQARRSWYVAAAQLPGLPEVALSGAFGRAWPRALRRLEGIEPRSGHPASTLVSDATTGLALYRTNMRRLPRLRGPVPAEVPVQLIVPSRDRYISTALYEDAERWAARIWRRDIRAGHWVQRSHPQLVARHVAELVEHAEGSPEGGVLRRTRWSGPRRRLQGRLAVVTGAGSGIGRATALSLAAEGAEVVVADIDPRSAEDTVAAVTGGAPKMFPMHVDVGDAAAMEEFAAIVQRDYGPPDIVVNNAGIGIAGPFLDTTLADWERIIDVNLWGVIHGSRLFAPQMVEAGVEGHIVNVASAAAFTPSRLLPAYSTTKAAVLMLSECMRAELAGAGIRVTAICPGLVNTNIVRTAHIVGVDELEEERLHRRGARVYSLRSYPAERVAEAILRALRKNPAVLPVTSEARALLALSRVSPAALRGLARIDPTVAR